MTHHYLTSDSTHHRSCPLPHLLNTSQPHILKSLDRYSTPSLTKQILRIAYGPRLNAPSDNLSHDLCNVLLESINLSVIDSGANTQSRSREISKTSFPENTGTCTSSAHRSWRSQHPAVPSYPPSLEDTLPLRISREYVLGGNAHTRSSR